MFPDRGLSLNKLLILFCLIVLFEVSPLNVFTVKPISKRLKIGFQDQSLLNAGQKFCRMLILQYFQPSLSYHLSSRSLFCLFLSGRLDRFTIIIHVIALGNIFPLTISLVNLLQGSAVFQW